MDLKGLRRHVYDVMPPFGRSLILLAALIVVIVGLTAILRMSAIDERLNRMETAVAEIDQRSYIRIENRVYMQQRGEPREDWGARVREIRATGDGEPSGYLCTTLSGCDVEGGEIEVCTPCNSRPPSQECIDRHQADIDVFCEEFECEDCPPAGS